MWFNRAFGYDLHAFGVKGIHSSAPGAANTYSYVKVFPTIRIGPTAGTDTTYLRGFDFRPTLDSFNRVRIIPFTNTVGSNMFNTTWGNTRIGYPLSTLTINNTTAFDTTFKLDVNGTGRFADDLYLTSGDIIYGPATSDAPLLIRKQWGGVTSPGLSIGAANTSIPGGESCIVGDRNNFTGNSSQNIIYGTRNTIDSSIRGIVVGHLNEIPNQSSHQLIFGYNNISNSYTNTQNASIVVGLNNNTNGFWGSGLIGSGLKYYENGALAFGGNSNNVNFATRNVYFGNGVKNENNNINSNFGNGPDVAINPSWANDVDSIDRNGGSLTIAGGRGTGAGTPGTVRFSTWNSTTSGSTLHPTLTERARISPSGNLLVGRTVDSIYKLDVNGTGRISSTFSASSGRGKLEAYPGDAVYVGGGSAGSRLVMSASSGNSSNIYFFHNGGYSGEVASNDTIGKLIINPINKLGFMINGAEKATLSPNGNLLINRTTQSTSDTIYKLDVNGTGRFTGDVTIDNTGYLRIPTNNKIQLGSIGPSYGFNTFIGSAIPNVEGQKNTYIGYSDGHNNTIGADNTVIGSVNNRTNVTGSNNVIIGTNIRNYLGLSMTQDRTIMIGNTCYTPSTTTFDKVIGLGFSNKFSDGGTYSNIIDFYGGSGRPQNNSLNFGSSDNGGIQLDNVYFNGNTNSTGDNGRSITINGSGAATSLGNNRNGGNIIIAGGKGAGSGTPGFIAFSTSTPLLSSADSLTLQTLTERARISPAGNLLIGTASDSTFRLNVSGRARISDTLTLSTTPATPDTSANDLLVINSSNGQVRRFTGDWYSVPLTGSDTLDFPSTGHGNSADLTITVTGASEGDVVALGIPNASIVANGSFIAWVSATNTVTVRFNNYASSGNSDPASGTFKIQVLK
jgi:hypothetical protein